METYTYSISGDLSEGCNIDCLQLEISRSESITTSLLGIKIDEDSCSIVFEDVLTTQELTELNSIVSAHSGEDLPDANKFNAGEVRHRVDGNNSYLEACVQTGAFNYEWVLIRENNW